MALDFDKMLETKAGDVERPVPAPVGTYIMRVNKVPAMDTIADGKYKKVTFNLVGVEPTEDVEDEFAEWPGNIDSVRVRNDFLFNLEDEDAFAKTEFAMTKFLTEHLGLDENLSLGELLNESANCQCMAAINHCEDKNDPENKFLNVSKTAPVE